MTSGRFFKKYLKTSPDNSVFGKFVNTTTFAENLGVVTPKPDS